MDHSNDVLVIGATGQQGGAVARHLLSRGVAVRALVRDTDKASAQALAAQGAALVRGDMEDAASLRAAFTGVRRVFSMQNGYPPLGPEGEVRLGTTVAQAAYDTGVEHLVYSSVGGAERDSKIAHFESKWRIEQRIRELGVPATIVRPVFFMDNFRSFLGPRPVDGTLVVRMAIHPDTSLQMISTDDLGAIVAEAFARPEAYLGKDVEVAADELTGTGIAEAFARATGTPARFEEQPIGEVRAFSEDTATMFEWFTTAGFRADLAALRADFPKLATLDEWLRNTHWEPPPPPAWAAH